MKARAIFETSYALHLQASLQGLAEQAPTFLCNPKWSPTALTEAAQQIPAGTNIIGEALIEPQGITPSGWPASKRGRLFIPTGGTGGTVKFVAHNESSLRAAVISLQTYLVRRGLDPILHCLSLTPPWHVSGLMPALRAHYTHGQHQILAPHFSATTPLPEITLPTSGTRIASLVPAQLTTLLIHPEGLAWLKAFKVILLGGSAVPEPLLIQIRKHRLPFYLTYGMTETAAACALCPPEKIWHEKPLTGDALPGVSWTLQEDRVCLETPALGKYFWPATPLGSPYVTGDRGKIHPDGSLEILGRADRIIISGGEKVDPSLVENELRHTGLVKEVHVWGVAHPRWGSQVTAFIVGSAEHEIALRQALEKLPPAQRPKAYFFGTELPVDERGKFDAIKAQQSSQA